MKNFVVFCGTAIAAALVAAACSSSAPASEQSIQAEPWFSGDGGKGISLAILAPRAEGLDENQGYIPALVQGEFVSNFSGYSAISVMDRENLDTVYAELLSGYYADDDAAGLDLGHLSATDYLLTGSITKTATEYALQIQITKTADKMTAASWSGTCTFAELDNLSGVRRASLELIEKMGVTLTAQARSELSGAAAANHVNAQTTLAQGITAQKSGTVVDALAFYLQSAGYDPGLVEAASRVNVLSADISSGNIGENFRNDIQWRKDWIARLTECEQFVADYVRDNPPFYLIYSTNYRTGDANYQRETMSFAFDDMQLYMPPVQWYETLATVVETVRQGLSATGRASDWGLNWPRNNVSGAGILGDRGNRIQVTAELRNDTGAAIGRQTVSLAYSYALRMENGRVAAIPPGIRGEMEGVSFTVKAADITDRLNLVISAIDGRPTEEGAARKHLIILTEDEGRNQGLIFSVGEIGPAGGYVFYDKGNNNGGWRYLEAAPQSAEFKERLTPAVERCKTLVINGYRGWRIPSMQELNLMSENLYKKGLGAFKSPYYMSSDPSRLKGFNRYDMRIIMNSNYQESKHPVRPVRAF
jgi:hypothetical protein